MKKKFNELSPEDFPGIDSDKFYTWKKARNTMIRNFLIFFPILILIFILGQVGVIEFGAIGWFIIAGCFGFLIPILTSKFNKLTKELKLNGKLIKKALNGEKVSLS